MSTVSTQAMATISSPTSRAANTVVDVVSNELLLLGKIEAAIEPALLSRPNSLNEDESGGPFSLGKSDAAKQGALVVSGFRSGAQSLIGACAQTSNAIARFRGNPSAIDEFLSALVVGNIISRSEARLGLASPKLSKFGAIGQSAKILCDERVFRYLVPGYTLIYQVTVLYNMLDGDEARRIERLVRELAALSPLSRERLIARTDEIKRGKKDASTMPSALDAARAMAGTDVHPVLNLGSKCDVGLITPDAQRDLWRLSEDYVAEPEFLRLARDCLTDGAVALVIARLADLSHIESKLLPTLGFPYVSQVCLVRAPIRADVTGADVLILAHRKQADFTTNFTWLADSEPLDAKALVERLIPDAGKKLHLFASDESKHSSDEWISVVGKANWGQSDE